MTEEHRLEKSVVTNITEILFLLGATKICVDEDI